MYHIFLMRLLPPCFLVMMLVAATSMTAVGAFQIGQPQATSTRAISTSNTVIPTTATATAKTTPLNRFSPFVDSRNHPLVVMTAKNTKKQQQPADTSSSSSEKEQQLDGWKLFLAYATPWRNPNSGLLYMIMLLYALGKYSESHPPGGVGVPY